MVKQNRPEPKKRRLVNIVLNQACITSRIGFDILSIWRHYLILVHVSFAIASKNNFCLHSCLTFLLF